MPAARLPDGDVVREPLEVEPRLAPPSAFQPVSPTLAPLRDRDLKVLRDWFAADDLDNIEADILSNLSLLSPEPCWEDDPFGDSKAEALDFLSEYL